ncbi:MAG: hypothetical protein KGR42_02760 [Acidobacteria bacterium]|nr:hypothetical protein [Acidobacteriota bacterium]
MSLTVLVSPAKYREGTPPVIERAHPETPLLTVDELPLPLAVAPSTFHHFTRGANQ